MSVRRLADDSIQPTSFAFTEENAVWAEATIRKYPEGRQQSAVIPLLMRAQEQEGWVTKSAVEHVAKQLGMPLIRVLEVATFYTQFMLQPVGTKAHVQVCGTTPCMLRGAEELKAVCRKKIHPEPFHRNESGTLSWEEVECQGACVNAPMIMIFKDAYEDLTPDRLAEIIDAFEAGDGASVTPGPQNGRHLSAPASGLTSLTEDYDDLISKQKQDGGSGPANGAPAQGSGAGASVSTPPSEAGRPDTHATESDPTIAAAGKASNGNVDQAAEDTESERLTAEAGPHAGQEGGTVEGATDQSDRDAAESGTVTGDVDATRAGDPTEGSTFYDKEAAARAAVLTADKTVAGEGADQAAPRQDRDVPDLLNQDGPIEGARRGTSDVGAGAVHGDSFESEAGTDEEAGAEEPLGDGEKPGTLLDAPREGGKDDLQKIRGIGPVIEARLNELGIFHFWQIAAWSRQELIWIDNYLKFRGRAVRDRWIEQAQQFAAVSNGNDQAQ